MKHVGTRGPCDVGSVVDGEQCAVPVSGVGEDFQGSQFADRLQRPEALFARRTLVTQLHDVDAACQSGVDELGEVAALSTRIRAQVQVGGPQAVAWIQRLIEHPRDVSDRRVMWFEQHGSPGPGTESGQEPALTVTPDPGNAGEGRHEMPSDRNGRTLAVVGGGVIGLSVARRAAADGWSVRVHRTQERGASWVAGGMIAPFGEGWPGEEKLLQIGLASLQMWHDGFVDGLPADVVTARESLVVAVDRADAADLSTIAAWLAKQGQPVTPTTAARDLEPLLAQGIRHGFVAETELAVDNRALVAALAHECERLGVTWAAKVTSLDDARDADTIVIANGIDAPSLWPGLPIRPVKGEVLRLRWRRGCMPLPERVIRARVHGRQVYLVPRADGVVVGATQYEHGRDTAPAVAGVRELLDDACEVMPALGEYELAECAAGLRPVTPDNVPIVGRLDERTLVAAGHGRSGFLLAPWTAAQIAAELAVGVPA